MSKDPVSKLPILVSMLGALLEPSLAFAFKDTSGVIASETTCCSTVETETGSPTTLQILTAYRGDGLHVVPSVIFLMAPT